MLRTSDGSAFMTGLPPLVYASNLFCFYPRGGVVRRELGDFVTTTNKHTRGIDGVLPAVDDANARGLAFCVADVPNHRDQYFLVYSVTRDYWSAPLQPSGDTGATRYMYLGRELHKLSSSRKGVKAARFRFRAESGQPLRVAGCH